MHRTSPLSLRLSLAVTCALAAVIGYGTLFPGAASPVAGGNDKLQHFLAFAGLSMPISLARPRWAIWTVVLALVYGGVIEVIQPFVGRDRSLLDLLADVMGASCGAGLAIALNLLLTRTRALNR